MSEERKIYTLTQLNQSLTNHIWKYFGSQYFWITAELIKINEKNGHHYLELADSNGDKTTARSSGVIWASTYRDIVQTIGLAETRSILQPGNNILFNVKIEYHEIYGLKLKIRAIDPTYSYGEIERKRQEVIEHLKKEKIFELQKEIKAPTIIKRIALIGSPNTSGDRDFQNELFNNYDFNQFKIKEFPVSVQGEPAVKKIAKSIQEANQYDVDAIVIIRGGGSKMDLALFDHYDIAKAICHSRLPIFTGIGHETDEVVADLVAHTHLITPTAVAQFIQYEIASFKEIMRELHAKTIQLAQFSLAESKEEFGHLSNYLLYHSRELIHHWRTVFQELQFDLHDESKTVLFYHRDDLSQTSHRVSSQLQQSVQQESGALDQLTKRISRQSLQAVEDERLMTIHQILEKTQNYANQEVDRERIHLSNQSELLELLNPLKILSSGYTISTVDDKDVQQMEIEKGQEMKTLSGKQLIISEIKNIQKMNHDKE